MPATWTVTCPVRVWRLRAGEWLLLLPGAVLTGLDVQGGNRTAVHEGEWLIIPLGAWDALTIVAPPATADAGRRVS